MPINALEHQAAGDGDADLLRLEFVVGGLAVPVLQVGRVVRGLEVVGEGDRRAGAQGGELFAAFGDELVLVVGGGCHGAGVRPAIVGGGVTPNARRTGLSSLGAPPTLRR